MKTLYIARHGETDWNAQQRFQGHEDIPLNERGRVQARELIPVFESHQVKAFLSSDLSRAVETAQIIASALALPHFQDPDLREAFLGHAQGMTRAEIEAEFGHSLASRWKSTQVTDADVSYPGGETGNQVMQRVFRGLENFVLGHPEFNTIAVVTHGGVIRRIMQRLRPPNSGHVPIPNGVIYKIHFDENGQFKI